MWLLACSDDRAETIESWATRVPVQTSEASALWESVSRRTPPRRMAGLGVQVLFGFLLALPFTVKFARLGAD
jgi:hypothetical protein